MTKEQWQVTACPKCHRQVYGHVRCNNGHESVWVETVSVVPASRLLEVTDVLRAAPMPYSESVLGGAWERHYAEWWHGCASKRALPQDA